MGGIYADILGLVAFATTVAHSLIHGGGAESTLKVAVIYLFLFAAIGLVLGRIAEWAMEDSLRSRLRAESVHHDNPVQTAPETEN